VRGPLSWDGRTDRFCACGSRGSDADGDGAAPLLIHCFGDSGACVVTPLTGSGRIGDVAMELLLCSALGEG